ncbi:MAG: type IV pilus assembly protein PilM [Patescibacteria group bacterium]|jgi:type IV pilus assembly protein PilM
MEIESSKNIFGLDISQNCVRLIQLKRKNKDFSIKSFNEVRLADGTIVNGEIKNQDKMTEAVKKLVKTVQGDKIKTKNLVAVLPEPKTFIKVIEIVIKNEKDNITKLVQEEIKNHIPLEAEDIYFDWQILSQNNNQTKIIVAAIPKVISDSYFDTLTKAGFIPIALEVEAIAIARALIKEKEEDPKKAKIIIDFGATRTSLIIYDHKAVQFTVSLPISGDKITETISNTLSLDAQKAEEAKIVCGLDQKKCEGAIFKILVASINNLADQIKKSIIFYKTNFVDSNDIAGIIICGGGANLSQIDKILTEALQIPTAIANPLINLGKQKGLNMPADKLLSYATAIGLALRNWQK